jgi:hypothetical protein
VEAAFVAAIAPTLAEGFRSALLIPIAMAQDRPEGPGVVLLDDRYRIESMSATAEFWLEQMVDIPRGSTTPLPHPVYAMAARARSIHGQDVRISHLPARARVPTRAGGWLVLHGVQMTGMPEGRTAVVIEPAPSPDVAPLIIEAYGLSDRERQIMQRAVQGRHCHTKQE